MIIILNIWSIVYYSDTFCLPIPIPINIQYNTATLRVSINYEMICFIINFVIFRQEICIMRPQHYCLTDGREHAENPDHVNEFVEHRSRLRILVIVHFRRLWKIHPSAVTRIWARALSERTARDPDAPPQPPCRSDGPTMTLLRCTNGYDGDFMIALTGPARDMPRRSPWWAGNMRSERRPAGSAGTEVQIRRQWKCRVYSEKKKQSGDRNV